MKKSVWMKLMLAGVVAAFALALAPAASAQPGTFVKGVLQPLADGFPKQAITIVVVDDAGSRDGIYARTIQEAARAMSPVPILVSDEPAPSNGTWYALTDVEKRAGGQEGYYPIVITPWGAFSDLHVEPIEKELGVKPSDMQMVTVTECSTYMIFQRNTAPWGHTWADLVKYGKANPGKLRYVSKDIGSGPDLACQWVLQHFGIKVTQIPQGSNAQRDATVAAGEADFTLSQAEGAIQHAAKVDVLLAVGSKVPPPWDKNPNVISGEKAGLPKGGPGGTYTGFAVPKEVPKAHVEWLYKLLSAAATSEIGKKREKVIPGTIVDPMTPEESQELAMKLYQAAGPIVRALGLAWDQKK